MLATLIALYAHVTIGWAEQLLDFTSTIDFPAVQAINDYQEFLLNCTVDPSRIWRSELATWDSWYKRNLFLVHFINPDMLFSGAQRIL